MKLGLDELARKFESLLGAGAVTTDATALDAFLVDGQRPALLCAPATAEQVGAVLRVCGEADAAATPWGGGTAVRIGNRPRRLDVVIALAAMNRLVEHDDANLTATAEAGMPLARMQEIVSERNQFLPFDAALPARASIGGVIAASVNGPRRTCYGSVRDLVIGIKAVLATGEQIKAGGKVVKNVAGYDLCKLFVGSLGTLGIITEATLRVAPLPERAATLVGSGTSAQVFELAAEIARSPLLPATLVILNPRASGAAAAGRRNFQLAMSAEGFEQTVARHLQDGRSMAERIGLSCALLEGEDHVRFWEGVRDFPLGTSLWVTRVTVPPASVSTLISAIQDWEAADPASAMISDALAGVIWISGAIEHGAAEQFAQIGALARAQGGHAIMLAATPEIKNRVDVWGAAPPAVSLMREIKRRFDPQHLLNPGRFVGGI
jgi:glycolate oxidase FAD binding subunit